MSFTVEHESPVTAERMFRAVVLDWHNIASKVCPENIESASSVEGSGGPGSVRQINFTSAVPFRYVKERLDQVDPGKLESKSTLIEGGELGTKLESASTHYKFEPKAGGGSIARLTATYKPIAGANVNEDVTKAKAALEAELKGTEAYLIAHPEAYA